MRQLEAAGARMRGAGVGAALDPEQLRLHQRLGDGRAVDRDERLVVPRADPVQHAREAFLADAGFSREQHGGIGGRHPPQQVAGGVEGRRGPHQRGGGAVLRVAFVRQPVGAGWRGLVVRLGRLGCAGGQHAGVDEIVGVQVAQVFAGVVPELRRFADHAAGAGAHRAALHFAEDHQVPEQRADVADRIAELQPAGRRGADAVGLQVFIVFARVVPQELALVAAVLRLVAEAHRHHLDHALQRMQPCAGDEDGRRLGIRPALAHQPCIVRARDVAGARQQPARAVDAEAVDQLAPQRAHRPAVQQQHALIVEPDASIAGREVQAFADVGQGRLGVGAPAVAAGGAESGARGASHFGERDAGQLRHGRSGQVVYSNDHIRLPDTCGLSSNP